MAEQAGNSRDPTRAALASRRDSQWRNRSDVISGRDAVTTFLTARWAREQDYRLIRQLWTHDGNRIAVRFAYEHHDAAGHWFRAYGNEIWQFTADSLMDRRIASINDLAIAAADRLFHWPSGRRPDDHPGLEALGL